MHPACSCFLLCVPLAAFASIQVPSEKYFCLSVIHFAALQTSGFSVPGNNHSLLCTHTPFHYLSPRSHCIPHLKSTGHALQEAMLFSSHLNILQAILSLKHQDGSSAHQELINTFL